MVSMKIQLRNLTPMASLDVAAQVLQAIDDRIDRETAPACFVSAFCNGREQGFRIRVERPNGDGYTIAFSEWRRSDSIVIYQGPSLDFDITTGLPRSTERGAEIWTNARFWGWNEIDKAAESIIKTLKEWIKQHGNDS